MHRFEIKDGAVRSVEGKPLRMRLTLCPSPLLVRRRYHVAVQIDVVVDVGKDVGTDVSHDLSVVANEKNFYPRQFTMLGACFWK